MLPTQTVLSRAPQCHRAGFVTRPRCMLGYGEHAQLLPTCLSDCDQQQHGSSVFSHRHDPHTQRDPHTVQLKNSSTTRLPPGSERGRARLLTHISDRNLSVRLLLIISVDPRGLGKCVSDVFRTSRQSQCRIKSYIHIKTSI